MKVLLDECVPWPLHRILTGHECQTAQHCGWGGLKNGELLKRAEEQFEVFVTADQNIRYQQNLADRKICIVELSTNDLRRLRAAAALIQTIFAALQPREYRQVIVP